jgi:hypothetical protein
LAQEFQGFQQDCICIVRVFCKIIEASDRTGGRIRQIVSMDLGLIVVFRFCLLPIQKRKGYWITRHYNLTFLPEQLYFMTVVNLKLPIRFEDLYWLLFFASWILEDKFNTFLLKQKLINKSIKGIFCKSKVKLRAIEKLRIQF